MELYSTGYLVLMADMRMLSTDLLMRLMPYLVINGGRALCTAFLYWLLFLLPGHGSNGDGERNCNGFVNLFDQNMTIHAYVPAVLALSMKG